MLQILKVSTIPQCESNMAPYSGHKLNTPILED